MGLSYFNNSSENFSTEFKSRNNPIDTWKDILTYSTNLNGNWLLSKQVFYTCIVPTAEKNPARFAKWINAMVKKSGTKIKARSEFLEAIKYLKKIKNREDRTKVKQALYYLFESGLEEPEYAYKALNNAHI